MSAGAPALRRGGTLGDRPRPVARRHDDDAAPADRVRPRLRIVTFAALAAYGTDRWATLLRPAPGWRLLAVLALAVVLAGGIPLLARRDRVLAGVAAVVTVLLAFPAAGLRWQWLTHLRLLDSAERIGTGLQQLPNALVPYVGSSGAVRLVIVLGAAVLLFDAAAVLAFAGRPGTPLGDGRRAAAALPLTALAVVPSTLIRPELPYLQGLILFLLLAAFLWGERVHAQTVGSALAIVAVAGSGAAIAAPRIDPGSPWVNYRAWAGTAARGRVDRFDWNQTYGPLHWPRSGHEVLAVRARTREYWKAEDLDTFDGYGWVQGTQSIQPSLPLPDRSALDRWTQTIQVTLHGIQTQNVIAAGTAAQPSPLAGGVGEGADPGTWIAGQSLGPGTSYTVQTYSPHPSPHQLAGAGRRYPVIQLAGDLTLTLPVSGIPRAVSPQVIFPAFGLRRPPTSTFPSAVPDATSLVRSSHYAAAYALARRLAAHARSPYAYVAAVQRYLSVDNGYRYSENPRPRSYPLESFLFTDKLGYCQQFSGSMTLLLRMGGIPARVASGFTGGVQQRAGDPFVVTDTDAHAWVEAWFPHYGWVQFDPTPLSAPARSGTAAAPVLKRLPGLTPGRGDSAPAQSHPGAAGATGAHHGGSGVISGWLVLAGVAALTLLAALAWVSRHLAADPDELVDELERAMLRTRRPLPAEVTLSALEQRFTATPGAAAYVRALRLARYGGSQRPPSHAQRRALRRELARGLGARGRLRALWAVPPRLVRGRRPGHGPPATAGSPLPPAPGPTGRS